MTDLQITSVNVALDIAMTTDLGTTIHARFASQNTPDGLVLKRIPPNGFIETRILSQQDWETVADKLKAYCKDELGIDVVLVITDLSLNFLSG